MLNLGSGKRLKQVEAVCEHVGRGVFKRIDENRELLELLQREAPELMQRFPWIEGWIEGQDEFLVQLAQAVGTENKVRAVADSYPRTWPGTRSEGDRKAFSF